MNQTGSKGKKDEEKLVTSSDGGGGATIPTGREAA